MADFPRSLKKKNTPKKPEYLIYNKAEKSDCAQNKEIYINLGSTTKLKFRMQFKKYQDQKISIEKKLNQWHTTDIQELLLLSSGFLFTNVLIKFNQNKERVYVSFRDLSSSEFYIYFTRL